MKHKKLYFLNSFYDRGQFGRDENGKSIRVKEDFLFTLIKDCETNDTMIKCFKAPKIDYYVVNEKNKYSYPKMSLPESELIKMTCPYKDRERFLAKSIGMESEYFESLRMKNRYEFVRNYVYNNPNLYMADMDIEDYYKNVFMEKFGRDTFKNYGQLKTGRLDIEVDQHGYFGPQSTGQNPSCPINLITYYDKTENKLYALILANQPDNEIMKQIRINPSETYTYIKELSQMEYNIEFLWYDDEPSLLVGMWNLLHRLKPDFVGIWNMNFDIPYILNRMEKLGMNLEEICCHPDVPPEFRCVRYIEDHERDKRQFGKGNSHPSRLWDWVNISGYTQFYDQMALYSIIRKRYILPSYKLDDISFSETGHRKLDYTSLGYDIRNLAWQDFKIFLAYGCVDTIRLEQIERVTGDLEKQIIFADNTRLSKSTSISYRIKNSMYRQYLDKKPRHIIGNDIYYPIIERLEGAIVADPDNLGVKGSKSITGADTYVYEYLCDYDFASLYPSVIINYQISKATLRGRIIESFCDGLPFGDPQIGEKINGALQTRDTSIFDFMNQYFELPNVDDMILEVENRGK